MKRCRVIAVILAASLMLVSCYDNREIDETAYIIAVGIDPQTDNDYKYTFQFSAPLATVEGGESGGGGEADENQTVNNVIIKAADFYIAKNMLNNFLSKNIDMSSLKLIVFSRKLSTNDFLKHSQLFLREREVRPHTCLAVAEEDAEGFLKSVNPELEANTAKYYELMALRSNNVYAPVKRLGDFISETENISHCSVLPIACISRYESSEEFEAADEIWGSGGVRQGEGETNKSPQSENKTLQNADKALQGADETKKTRANTEEDTHSVDETNKTLQSAGETSERWVKSTDTRISSSRSDMRGMAVFVEGELVGEMNGDSAMVYNILNSDIKRCNISIRNKFNPGETVSFRVFVPKRARFRVKRGGVCRISVETELKMEFLGTRLPEGYGSFDELYDDAKNETEKKISEFLYYSARKLGADLLETGRCYRKGFSTQKKLESADWETVYKNAEFSVSVNLI